ncbi:LuxR C-terminal-related transcriptional regulator [Rhizobium sp. NFR03]|uniref:helix-turn-helix transcriptional regulator n=1 Tax=Rhizobium sp. NFR03 TaxID=1566263 RepID=UPI0008BB9745|nr:LuxR C-terminal-related transcriptional regulator [Rhizobium sp. NFR03]SER97304.1 DNA-binding transcriptional regulator, CsgD family [Rhizobium sp. NFR03]
MPDVRLKTLTMNMPDAGRAGDAAENEIAEIARLNSCDDVIAHMTRITSARGFPFFLLCTLPTVDQTKYSEILILSNVPDSIVQRYDDSGSVRENKAFATLRTTTTPFRMTVDDCRKGAGGAFAPERETLMEEMDFYEAIFFPVHDAAGGRAVFIFLSRNVDLAIDVMTDLHMVCLRVYNRLVSIGGMGGEQAKVDLSDREIQCLNWTAAGKTSSEIADILGLSEHTVNHYLNHVAKKLDAVNRVQAVVKAMRLGLIS